MENEPAGFFPEFGLGKHIERKPERLFDAAVERIVSHRVKPSGRLRDGEGTDEPLFRHSPRGDPRADEEGRRQHYPEGADGEVADAKQLGIHGRGPDAAYATPPERASEAGRWAGARRTRG